VEHLGWHRYLNLGLWTLEEPHYLSYPSSYSPW